MVGMLVGSTPEYNGSLSIIITSCVVHRTNGGATLDPSLAATIGEHLSGFKDGGNFGYHHIPPRAMSEQWVIG